jgi:hypothetical protein
MDSIFQISYKKPFTLQVMNLIFYPSDFNLTFIKQPVRDLVDDLKIHEAPYRLFNYNHISVAEVDDPNWSRSYGRNLSVAFDYIKIYALNHPAEKLTIHLFTDGNSNCHKVLNMDDYLIENIQKLYYCEKTNPHFLGERDYDENWLNNKKFHYIQVD